MVLFISYTPVNCNDTSGEWFLNYVAFGFQIELSAGPISGGVEFVITTDLKNVYVFTYLGLSISTLNPDTLKKIIIEGVKEILSNPKNYLNYLVFHYLYVYSAYGGNGRNHLIRKHMLVEQRVRMYVSRLEFRCYRSKGI